MTYQSKLAKAIQDAVQDCIDDGSGRASVFRPMIKITTDWSDNENDIEIYIETGNNSRISLIEQGVAEALGISESKKTVGKKLKESSASVPETASFGFSLNDYNDLEGYDGDLSVFLRKLRLAGLKVTDLNDDGDYGVEFTVTGDVRTIWKMINNKVRAYHEDSIQDFYNSYSIDESKKVVGKKLKESASLDKIHVGDVLKVRDTGKGGNGDVDISIEDIYFNVSGYDNSLDAYVKVKYNFVGTGKASSESNISMKNLSMYLNGEYGTLRESKDIKEATGDQSFDINKFKNLLSNIGDYGSDFPRIIDGVRSDIIDNDDPSEVDRWTIKGAKDWVSKYSSLYLEIANMISNIDHPTWVNMHEDDEDIDDSLDHESYNDLEEGTDPSFLFSDAMNLIDGFNSEYNNQTIRMIPKREIISKFNEMYDEITGITDSLPEDMKDTIGDEVGIIIDNLAKSGISVDSLGYNGDGLEESKHGDRYSKILESSDGLPFRYDYEKGVVQLVKKSGSKYKPLYESYMSAEDFERDPVLAADTYHDRLEKTLGPITKKMFE